MLVEYALGAALEQLKYSRERYWKELRVALPMNVGLSRFDERADLTQVGVVALSLIIGRPLRDDEYPRQIEDLVAAAQARDVNGSSRGVAVNAARVAEARAADRCAELVPNHVRRRGGTG